MASKEHPLEEALNNYVQSLAEKPVKSKHSKKTPKNVVSK